MSHCRGCGTPLRHEDALCDLGALPLANSLLSKDALDEPEIHYPLRPLICTECLLVQLPELPREDIFTTRYPFFSGQSATWLGHCRDFADYAIAQFGLGATSRVLEIGSNDGSMLRRFRGQGIPALGVEPCSSVAQHALMEGLPTVVDFWGVDCAERLLGTTGISTGKSWRADLVIANNVLAHVPDLQDFLCGVRTVLEPTSGVAVFEVAYLGRLVQDGQFDQVYAEHYSYFSINSLCTALEIAGLRPTSVEFVPTHGGSIRVFADTGPADVMLDTLYAALERERASAWHSPSALRSFAAYPPQAKREALLRLSGLAGNVLLAGYGASAKAISLLSYLGVGTETVPFIADTTPAKWGRYTPGSHIPIRGPQQLTEADPEFVINFLWNWREESEANIRRACPGAQIVYLREQEPALQVAA